jgi:hypothetical protein
MSVRSSIGRWLFGKGPNRATVGFYLAAVPFGVAGAFGGAWLQHPAQSLAGGTCLVLLLASSVSRLLSENRRTAAARREGG